MQQRASHGENSKNKGLTTNFIIYLEQLKEKEFTSVYFHTVHLVLCLRHTIYCYHLDVLLIEIIIRARGATGIINCNVGQTDYYDTGFS